MRKKVGIITQHRVFNYGSVLQTYATQKIFEKHNCDCYVIDYISDRCSNKKIFWNIDKSGNKVSVFIYKILRLPIIIKRKYQFSNFLRKYINLSKKYLSHSDLVKNPPIADIYVVGSDQCWNSFYNGVDKAYYLQFGDKSIKRISFSTSIGNNKLTIDEKNEISKYLTKFDFISVRENQSVNLISKICKKNVISVIDPTLQLRKCEWDLIAKNKRLIKEDYVLLFVLYDEDLGASDIARKIADKHNLKVVELSWQIKKKNGVDILMSHKTPNEFISLIRDASFVVTNSFHGLSFCINYEKEFIVVERTQFNDRISNLLQITNLENRMVNENNFSLNILDNKINYKDVNKRIEDERKKAENYINEVLR